MGSELVVLREGGRDVRLVEDLKGAQLKHVVGARMSLPPVQEDLRRKQPVEKASLLFAKLLAVAAVTAEDDTPDLAPQSPEAILAERKRAAGYELERYLQAEVLDAKDSSQTVLNWWFEKRLVCFPSSTRYRASTTPSSPRREVGRVCSRPPPTSS